MRIERYDINAPALSNEPFNEAEVLGSAVWLWMHSDSHRNVPLHLLTTLLLPTIKAGQFILASENGKPVFYLSWATMSEEAERRYLRNPPQFMPPADWTSGDRLWILDWVAPFGHSQQMREIVKRHLFAGLCARTLYHRGEEKGLRVIDFHGIAVTAEETHFWFKNNPPALAKRPETSPPGAMPAAA